MLSPLRTNCLPHLADVAKPIWGDPTEVQHSVWWRLHKTVQIIRTMTTVDETIDALAQKDNGTPIIARQL